MHVSTRVRNIRPGLLYLHHFLPPNPLYALESAFRKFGIITIVAVYLLILVGGIVRSTGSGMGCPDWPKCFGQWVPPTEVSELPADYKQRFQVQGKEIADFDAFKTWTEYLNRLLGVLIGLFIFVTLVLSVAYLKKDPPVFYTSLITFLMVGFQGWLGSVVVASDLKPVTITLHMLVALLITAVLIFAVTRARQAVRNRTKLLHHQRINYLLIFSIVLSLVQIVLGTQVREMIDHVAKALGESARHEWIDQLGGVFLVHRSFSLLVLGVHGMLVWELLRQPAGANSLKLWGYALLITLLLETASGVIMAYFSIPAFMQPIHLLLAAIAFGIQAYMGLLLNPDIFFPKQHQADKQPQYVA